MSPTYDETFAASFARILGDGAYNADFIGRFYELFFATSDDIKQRFAHTDMSHQKTMLHDSLRALVDFNQHRKLSPQMTTLARVHGPQAADIPPTLYVLWLNALLDTVREWDPKFDAQVELAWRLTLAPGITYLKFCNDHPTGP